MANPTTAEYLDDMHMAVPWTEEECANGDDLKILMYAFRELKRNLHEYTDLTVRYQRRIDLSAYKVKDFIECRRANVPAGLGIDNTSAGNVFTALAGMTAVSSTQSYDAYFDYYVQTMLVQNIKNSISTDLQFMYDEQNKLLYVSANTPYPVYITLTYIADYDDPSELKTSYWQDWMRRLAIAHFKVFVGQKRSKMKIQNSPVQLNGEELLQEGLNELKEIREYLAQNNTPIKIK